jgi:hypothetical protein
MTWPPPGLWQVSTAPWNRRRCLRQPRYARHRSECGKGSDGIPPTIGAPSKSRENGDEIASVADDPRCTDRAQTGHKLCHSVERDGDRSVSRKRDVLDQV